MAVYKPIWWGTHKPDLASALGDMLLTWTWAESEQVNLFAVILKLPHHQASRLYQKLPNFRSRTQALLTMIDMNPEYEELKPFILKFSKLSKTRNKYVHGGFIEKWGGSDLRVVDFNEPSESPKRSKPAKAADIINHSEAVRRCCTEFHDAAGKCQAYKAWVEPHATDPTTAPDPQDTP